MKRSAGVLMPVFSLPSAYGIGCFSREAREFVDKLVAAGQSYWQILPLGPTGYGDSPYQAFSTFAGNPYFIDLETLKDEELLTDAECADVCAEVPAGEIDYAWLYRNRPVILKKAFARFVPDETYNAFVEENAYWLEDYALFMAIKDSKGGVCWTEWEQELKIRDEKALGVQKVLLAREVDFYKFQQFMFHKQWMSLKTYANENGIQIIGDIPIYVSLDSSDAWANPELFAFDEDCVPTAVAGCPPDAFSATGQLWGNPLYRWEYHEKTGFAWWLTRLSQCFTIYDVVRIDHFRGFESYYAIPYGDLTAENGHWEKGPGMKLFDTVNAKMGQQPIIAEDLGYLTQEVMDMLADSGYPGMKIIQFAFDAREASNYLPYLYPHHCVVYTGTHDNTTLLGWLDELSEEDYAFAEEYMDNADHTKEHKVWDFIRLAVGSVADLCVIPMQDYLGLGKEARINHPSTLGGNWTWRMEKDAFSDALVEKVHRVMQLYARV